MRYWIYIYFFLFLKSQAQQEDVCIHTSRGDLIDHERSLLTCLLSDYKPDFKPILKPGQVINVTIYRMYFFGRKVDETDGKLSMQAYYDVGWTDPQLSWNESEFGNLNEIDVLKKKIWIPDLIYYNGFDSLRTITYDEYATINSSGYVRYKKFRTFDVYCSFEYTRFPYDNQHCRYLFGSVIHDITVLDLIFDKNDIDFYVQHDNYWVLERFSAKNYSYMSQKGKKYALIWFDIKLLRSSPFDQVVLVLPSAIIAMLIFALFWTPIDSNQRFVLSGAIMISIFILMTTVKYLLPIDIAGVPVIVTFLAYLLVMLLFSNIISLFSHNFFYRDYRKHQIPDLVKKIFLHRYLSKVLLVSNESFFDTSIIIDPINASKDISDLYSANNASASSSGSDSVGYLSLERPTVESTLDDIKKYLKTLVNKKSGKVIGQSEKSVHQNIILSEWHRLSLTIDRLASLIYLSITFIVTVSLAGKHSRPYLPYDDE